MNIQQRLGARIFELRKKASMTQAQLAEAVELTDEFVSLIERGQRSPSLETLKKIADILKVEIKELFNFSDEEMEQIGSNQELIKLAVYLRDKKADDIKIVHKVAKIIFER